MSTYPHKSIGHTPFIIIMVYICGSMLIYWFGSIKWPMTNHLELAIFQILVIFSIVLGYFSATKTSTNKAGIKFRRFFKVGVLLTLALQIPVTLTYTDKYPWDVFKTVMAQNESYKEMLEHIENQSGTRFYVPLFRSLSMPFFYAAMAYGILHFKNLTRLNKILLVLLILCPIDISFLRGTDKEFFDLVIILAGLAIVHSSRSYISSEISLRIANRRRRQKRRAFVLTAFFTSIGLFYLFTFRKSDRFGHLDEFCMGGICSDHSGFIMSLLPDFIRFGISMFTFYVANGYYGLSLVLKQPFSFTYGIGHSFALLSLSARFQGHSLLDSSAIGLVSASGWDYHFFWFTIFPWIANDVGFLGSLFVIGFIGRLFHQAWMDSVYSKNDTAAIVFVLLCLLFFYLPANNQITQTLDLYFTFVVAMFAWKLPKLTRRLA